MNTVQTIGMESLVDGQTGRMARDQSTMVVHQRAGRAAQLKAGG